MHAKVAQQQVTGAFGFEMPGRAPGQAATAGQGGRQRPVLADQQFGGIQAFQFARQAVGGLELLDAEAPAGEIKRCQPEPMADRGDGHQQVVATVFQQGLLGDRAGGDDAHHTPLHRPLGGRGIADLFADGDRFTQFDQPRQIALGGMVGQPGHGDAFPGGFAACRQGDIQQLGGPAGIVIKELVKIAHAEKHQPIGVVGFDAQVLLHQGCVLGGGGWLGHGPIVYRIRRRRRRTAFRDRIESVRHTRRRMACMTGRI